MRTFALTLLALSSLLACGGKKDNAATLTPQLQTVLSHSSFKGWYKSLEYCNVAGNQSFKLDINVDQKEYGTELHIYSDKDCTYALIDIFQKGTFTETPEGDEFYLTFFPSQESFRIYSQLDPNLNDCVTRASWKNQDVWLGTAKGCKLSLNAFPGMRTNPTQAYTHPQLFLWPLLNIHFGLETEEIEGPLELKLASEMVIPFSPELKACEDVVGLDGEEGVCE